ncbi:SH3 domain-containing protein [Streptomyces sp. NPDC002671]
MSAVPSRTHHRPSGRLKRTAVVSAISLALAGGVLAVAPAASAVGQSACYSPTYNMAGHVTTDGVNLRSGPGTSYSSYGLLYSGTRLTWICEDPYSSTGYDWDYVKIRSGAHSGTYGWVYGKYWTTD